jgi:diguanylate cyclase (GGDEF)-like protein/PAS domain S-box-containing protein
MSTTPHAERKSNPLSGSADVRLRISRGLATSVAPRLDRVVLLAALWTAGFLALAVGMGRGSNGHALASDLWLIPTGFVIAILGSRLASDDRLATRDRLPWRLMVIAGLAMPAADAAWLVADPPLRLLPTELAAAVGLLPLVVMGAAILLFRSARTARPRPRSQFALDLMATVVVAGLTLWYFVFDRMPAAVGTDLLVRVALGGSAVLAVAMMSRIALRPTEGLSPGAATVLVLGGATAVVGFVATSGPGPVGSEAAAIGQISLGLLPCALVVGGRLELLARGRAKEPGGAHGPSPLFYTCVVVGSIPPALLAVNLGTHYVVVVATCLGLSAVAVIRQLFTVREAVQSDKARRKTETRFGWLVRNSSDFIMAVDAEGTIDYVSPSVERLLTEPADQLLGTRLTDLSHPDDTAELTSLLDRAMASPGRQVRGEWRIRQSDDSWLPVETVASSGTGDFDTSGVVLNTRDLRERKALEQKLTFQAFHDPLTRLANRSLFRERVEHALDHRNLLDEAVLFIDLDNFKTINDSLGHAAGDHVLVETAHRVRSCLRTEDTAARLGGDEFAVLLEEADVTTAARVAERIRVALGTPFWVLGQEVYISASIGIAVRRDGDTAGELLRNADVAMYTAKSKGKACFEIFEPAMHDAVVARLGLEAELRRAVERQEFVVHYQPIVKLETGEVIGAEALVRWQHPTRGIVPPLEFIPLAEETGLIVPLGSWILRQSCRQLAEWQKLRGGGEPFVMNVNLSSRQLVREAIADEVAAAVDDSGIRASWLVLEVTETVLMADPVVAAQALSKIRDLGVRVALDDFGSGYSSLSHLRRFPIDIVKIDKSFVDDVAHEGAESAIARGIIELGHAMKIQTVAEGIEVDEQAEVLRSLGCELGQGFFFAKPLAADAWATLLSADQVGYRSETAVVPGAPELPGPPEVPGKTARVDAGKAGSKRTAPLSVETKGTGAAASSARPRRRAAA